MPNCEHCDKPLTPIGTSRKNGKNHNDWYSRTLHKKCWKELEDTKFPRYGLYGPYGQKINIKDHLAQLEKAIRGY